jgi:hypothetical protein
LKFAGTSSSERSTSSSAKRIYSPSFSATTVLSGDSRRRLLRLEGPDDFLPPDRAPNRQLQVGWLLIAVGLFIFWGLVVYFLLGLFM